MTQLYLVRHGETEWNREKRIQGWQDSPLTEKGVRNAELLAQYWNDMRFDAVFSSDRGRALQTASILSKASGVPVEKESAFREINFGAWEGKKVTEIREQDPKEYDNFWERPEEYKSVGGESFFEVRARILNRLKEIVSVYQNKKVLIVSHAVAIKTVINDIKGKSLAKFWDPPFLADTSFTIIHALNNHWKLECEALYPHLAGYEVEAKPYNEN